jgi:hypothetical protein
MTVNEIKAQISVLIASQKLNLEQTVFALNEIKNWCDFWIHTAKIVNESTEKFKKVEEHE